MKRIIILVLIAFGLQIVTTPYYTFPMLKTESLKGKGFCDWFRGEFKPLGVMTVKIVEKGLTGEEARCVRDVLGAMEGIVLIEKENEDLALEEFMHQDKIPADLEKMNTLGKILVADHLLVFKKEIEFPKYQIGLSLIEIETSKGILLKTFEGSILERYSTLLVKWMGEFYPLIVFFALAWFIVKSLQTLSFAIYDFFFPWLEFRRARKDFKNEFYYSGIERLTLLLKKYPNHKIARESYRILKELKEIVNI